MTAPTTRHTRRTVGGFAVHTLSHASASVSLVPELGGRIVSLRDRVSGREWIDGWSPAGKRRIWHPTDPADFATGPGAGIDECLPTVLPCEMAGQPLPDHGEIWNQPASFREDLSGLSCSWTLKTLPLAFERRISLRGDTVLLDYRLENLADSRTPFLWCWHPLFAWKIGDEIRFPQAVKSCLTGDGEMHPWPHFPPGCDLARAHFPEGATPAAKVFVGPLTEGTAQIEARSGARLTIGWPARDFPYAGIWITRGFWKGLHHWAIEPTNAPVDCLSDVPPTLAPRLTQLEPHEVRTWQLSLGLASSSP